MRKQRSLVPSIFDEGFLPNFFRNYSLFDEGMFPDDRSNLSISEDKENVYIEAHMPGLRDEDIDVTLNKGVIWIKGERNEEDTSSRKYYHKANRSFSYQIALPSSCDESKEPKAKFENGVLALTFAKLEVEVPKKIKIGN